MSRYHTNIFKLSTTSECNNENPFPLSEDQLKILENELNEFAKLPEEGSSWEEVKKRILFKK